MTNLVPRGMINRRAQLALLSYYRNHADAFVDKLEQALKEGKTTEQILLLWQTFCAEVGCQPHNKSTTLLDYVIKEYHSRGLHVKEARYRPLGIVI